MLEKSKCFWLIDWLIVSSLHQCNYLTRPKCWLHCAWVPQGEGECQEYTQFSSPEPLLIDAPCLKASDLLQLGLWAPKTQQIIDGSAARRYCVHLKQSSCRSHSRFWIGPQAADLSHLWTSRLPRRTLTTFCGLSALDCITSVDQIDWLRARHWHLGSTSIAF